MECFLGEERRKTRSSASSHLSGEWRAADGPHAFEAQVEPAKWLDKDPVRLGGCETAKLRGCDPQSPGALDHPMLSCSSGHPASPWVGHVVNREPPVPLSSVSHDPSITSHPEHSARPAHPARPARPCTTTRVEATPEVLTVGDPREHNFFRSSSFVFRPPPFVLWPPHWFYISPEHRGYHPNAARRNKLVRASLVR